MDAINSRNDIETFTYFFVTRNNKRTLSNLPVTEFFIYEFQNPVSAERGISQLKDEYTISVLELSNETYNKGSFDHPKYRNQKNEYIRFRYNELPVTIVSVEESRIVK